MQLLDPFDRDTLVLLKKAYSIACNEAGLTARRRSEGGHDGLRLAHRIMALAARGERDVGALTSHALRRPAALNN